ncbi:MAG: hypothetical protein A3G27_07285 [Betaproteobacteria bacterium RIFCSPLOWO2_12_FULL_66_14]|nr:MAG: hypothetical protein A3G27_07285 [Betaproteobacteria bacterium RIFCSPLOWO2_12_FULL_66_14]
MPRFFAAAAFAAGILACPAAAQDYPKRAVKVVVPFPAGGAMDVATRILVSGIEPSFTVPFIIENRPGASGNIGTVQVAQSPADGHTLLLGIAANTSINRFLYKSLPFDVDRDLVPVAQFGSSTNIIYVAKSFPARDFAALLRHLKAGPGKENYVTPGVGTTPHLAMELIKMRTKSYVVHVPFGGSTAAISAVFGGEASIGIDAVIAAAPGIRSGRLRAIAVTGTERSSVLPDVPTLREVGLDIDVSTYLGIFAPAKIPPAIVEKLGKEIEHALRKEEVGAKLRRVGIEPLYGSRQQFAERIRNELPMWQQAVSYSGASNF